MAESKRRNHLLQSYNAPLAIIRPDNSIEVVVDYSFITRDIHGQEKRESRMFVCSSFAKAQFLV